MSLRLHLNEHTGGCSPAVLDAIRNINPIDVSIYPDYGAVTTTCERWLDVSPGWVQLTNGLDEGLHVAAQWSGVRPWGQTTGSDHGVRPSGLTPPSALIVEPAFEMYPICAEAAGLAVIRVFWDPREAFPTDVLLDAITAETRLIYLTDPNNPTGLPIPSGVVEQIAAAAPHIMVLLDEAYAEFSGRTLIGPALDRHRNLVIGRTFAKAHGLAALRAGALVAHPDTLAPLRRILPPFSLNICAVRALEAALGDRAHLDHYVRESAESRQLVYDFATRHGFRCWKSEANFVLVEIGANAPAVVDAVATRGILIKDRSRQPGCAGCVRITTGIVAHTQLCLAELEDVLASRPR
jgi:histidinol-phosphate aminotransferase